MYMAKLCKEDKPRTYQMKCRKTRGTYASLTEWCKARLESKLLSNFCRGVPLINQRKILIITIIKLYKFQIAVFSQFSLLSQCLEIYFDSGLDSSWFAVDIKLIKHLYSNITKILLLFQQIFLSLYCNPHNWERLYEKE